MERLRVDGALRVDGDLLTIADFEVRSREILPRQLFDIIFGGYGVRGFEGNTHSIQAFDNSRLRPRVLAGVGTRRLSTSVLGEPITSPLMIAPAGYHQRAHPEGELATARAAAAAGTVFTVATASTYSIEEVAEASAGPLWFQLYVFKDREVDRKLVARAEQAGYKALMVTVDQLGRSRERETRFDFTKNTEHRTIRTIDPARVLKNFQGMDGPNLDGDNYHGNFDRDVTWSDVAWLRSCTSLPIIIKGIQTGEDAALARDAGIDAVVVSNHGGHGSPDSKGTLEILPEVVAQAGTAMEVYLDGGIRRGADILKAVALGARAVLVARAALWGLAVDGQAGVERVLDIFRSELDGTMTLCGVGDVQQAGPDLVELPGIGGRAERMIGHLGELAGLHEAGRLTDDEFRLAKQAVISAAGR
jgi:4-hydroxymandelate oxidase